MSYDYENDPRFEKTPNGFVRNEVAQAPVDQMGAKTEYPTGCNGHAYRRLGPLSQLVAAASGVRFKIAEGFVPRSAFAKCAPIVDTIHEGCTKTLVAGDSVAISGVSAANVGTFALTVAAAAGSDSDSDADVPAPFVKGAVTSPALVEDDDTWFTVTGTGTLSGDCIVEVGVWAEQVDPHPPKQF